MTRLSRFFVASGVLVLVNLNPCLPGAEKPLRDIIDAEVQARWKDQQIEPAGTAPDAVFLRRVYLDLVGGIPTYEETTRFLADTSPDKREKLIDQLLDDPRYAVHQADVWDMILFGRNPPGYYSDKREGFQKWLHDQFAKNVPYDRMVEQILKAEGNTVDDGPAMYLVQYERQPEDATVAITQTFLGVQLQCARCHDHPHDVWKQKDFYGMAAFLARLEMVQVGKAGNLTKLAIGEKNTGDILFTGPAKDQKPGQKGEPIKPQFLKGEVLAEPASSVKKEDRFPAGKMPPRPSFSRKDRFAEWMVSPENPYFARAIANRLWGQFMGKGLADPVDNLSDNNPASHPALLDALARAMLDHKFDMKWFIRELCNSKTYQLPATGPTEEAHPLWYERARVRPLSAEELIESWRTATGYDAAAASARKSDDRYRPLGSGYMLRFFGQPTNGVGEFQGGLHEHLYLNNGPVGQVIAQGKGGLHDTLLSSKSTWEERVDRLYLSILSRPPQPEERKQFVTYLTAQKGAEGSRLHDAIWVLLTCSEFRFNH